MRKLLDPLLRFALLIVLIGFFVFNTDSCNTGSKRAGWAKEIKR